MEKVALAAKKRESFGSAESRRIRRAGEVPATLYGHGMKPVSLQVASSDFTHMLHTKAGENVVVDLNIDGVSLKESTCLIKDIQHHPVTDHVIHIDFTVISMNEEIEVSIPLSAVNTEDSLGIKDGGVLDLVHHEITISCLPTEIPEKVEVDIKELKIGGAIHVRELQLPSGVKCVLEAEEVVVAIHAPRVEVEAEAAEEGAEDAAQPEVIEKGKKPEEGEEAKAEDK